MCTLDLKELRSNTKLNYMESERNTCTGRLGKSEKFLYHFLNNHIKFQDINKDRLANYWTSSVSAISSEMAEIYGCFLQYHAYVTRSKSNCRSHRYSIFTCQPIATVAKARIRLEIGD